MPRFHWYDAFGGVAGSAAVLGGLLLVHKIGSGPLNGLTVTGNILASLALDCFGMLGLPAGGFRPLPWIGGAIMIVGVIAITLGAGKRTMRMRIRASVGSCFSRSSWCVVPYRRLEPR